MNTPLPPPGESSESNTPSPRNPSWSWESAATSHLPSQPSQLAQERSFEQTTPSDRLDVAGLDTARSEAIQARTPRPPSSHWGGLAFVLVLGAILGGIGGYFAGRSEVISPSVVKPTPVTAHTIIYNVTGVTGSTIETISSDGVPVLVYTNSTTSYQRAGFPATLSDIKAGARITIKGNDSTRYTRTADRILIVDAIVSGTIQKISGDSIELRASAANITTTITVALDSSTQVYDQNSHQPVNRSSLHIGENATVYGAMLESGAFGAAIITVAA